MLNSYVRASQFGVVLCCFSEAPARGMFYRNGCFYKKRVHFDGVLITRALLFLFYTWAPVFWKLPNVYSDIAQPACFDDRGPQGFGPLLTQSLGRGPRGGNGPRGGQRALFS